MIESGDQVEIGEDLKEHFRKYILNRKVRVKKTESDPVDKDWRVNTYLQYCGYKIVNCAKDMLLNEKGDFDKEKEMKARKHLIDED